MFRSIADDIKASFDYGNMVVRLIIINVAVYMVTALIEAFVPDFYHSSILPYLALPGDPILILYRPWTLFTHMFLHSGLWHLIWNMVVFYTFGNIAGDLLGDRKILPIYIIGGLFGASAYILSYQFMPAVGSFALGASAAVMAIVFAAVVTAPDYMIHLILLGPVRIKFIGLFVLFFDIIGVKSGDNSGGHIAHLGGTLFGFLFVYLLKEGIDFSKYWYQVIDFFSLKIIREPKRKSNLKVTYRSPDINRSDKTPLRSKSMQSRVDEILEKIKQKGYESLTDEEKEVLYQASKNE
ncbi:MAG: rhomboid family intramembrane serine protease [Saprospiraceae bacterium]|nr:rhomboid family intramembrane serine protease [Saprospiraceae bacterium]